MLAPGAAVPVPVNDNGSSLQAVREGIPGFDVGNCGIVAIAAANPSADTK